MLIHFSRKEGEHFAENVAAKTAYAQYIRPQVKLTAAWEEGPLHISAPRPRTLTFSPRLQNAHISHSRIYICPRSKHFSFHLHNVSDSQTYFRFGNATRGKDQNGA